MSGSIMTLVDQNGSQYKLVYQTKSLTDATEILTRKEAALILAEYIFKSTGWNFAADWTDDTEPQPNKAGDSFVKNIFVGDSDWVRKLGVTFSNFTPETYLIQVLNDNLILAGLDSPGDPWNLSTTYGTSNTVYARPTTPTLHAVSAFLQTYVKARWYWPGWSPADEKLLGRAEPSGFGESYDDLHSIGLKLTLPLNRTEQPTSSLRDLELPWYPMSLHNLGFSYDKNPTGNSFASMMSRRYKRWIRLNRLGGFDQIYVQHYWYSLMPKARYGEVGQTSLPPGPADFYAFYKYDPAQPAKRGGNEEILPFNNYPIDGKYQICVSGTDTTQKENPKILTEIVNYPSDGTIDKSGDTGGIAYQILHTASQPQHSISIAPNDDDGHCTCALCYEKDNVKPTGTANQFTYDTNYLSGTRNLGDRYFWFFNKVAKMVSQQSAALHSPCWVTTFAYGDYILPYSVKASVKAGSVSLEKNLIVYDTHNTYLFRNYDVNQAGATLPETVNAAAEQHNRIEKWGAVNGHLAVWADLHWHGMSFMPFYQSAPLSCPTSCTDLLARLNFNRYMGGYFIMGLAHWSDLYLIARLFSEAPTPVSGETFNSFLTRFKQKAEEIRGDYYKGLFGVAADEVKAFHLDIERSIQSYLTKATTSSPFYTVWTSWNFRTMYEEIFKPVKTSQSLIGNVHLDKAQSLLNESSRESAQLQVVIANWNFTNSVNDFLFLKLDKYATQRDSTTEGFFESLFSYTPAQLAMMRDVGSCLIAMLEKVNDVNNEQEQPDLCSITLPPNTMTGIDSQDILTNSPSKATVKSGRVRKVIRSILAIQNDVPPDQQNETLPDKTLALKWPLGIAPAQGENLSQAVRHEPSDQYLTWRAVDAETGETLGWETANLWIDWYSRVGNEIYIVVINETNQMIQSVELTLRNMDPKRHKRRLEYYYQGLVPSYKKDRKPSPAFSCEDDIEFPEDFDPLNPRIQQSLVSTDIANFVALPGVTILVLKDANFAPYTLKIYGYYDAGQRWDTTFTVSELNSGIEITMYPTDDCLLASDSSQSPQISGGRFYIADKDLILRKTVMADTIHAPKTKFVETLKIANFKTAIEDASIDKYNPKSPAYDPTGTYYICGAAYDNKGSKRMAVDDDGTQYCLTITIEEDHS